MALLPSSQSSPPLSASAKTPQPFSSRPAYSRPLLTVMFNVSGMLTLIVGGFLLVGGSKNQQPIEGSILSYFGLAISGLVQFGIAQVIDYVGQIAYNTTPQPSKIGEPIR